MGLFDLFKFKKKSAGGFVETRREDGIATYETAPKKVVEVAGITITSNFVINKDEETAALHREATRLRDAGDLDSAIVALQKVQERMRKSSFSNTAERWVRLPLFLQQAGRFNEAELEFQRLLDDLPDLARREVGIGDRSVYYGKGTSKKSICNLIVKTHKNVINEKWALAKQREDRRLAKLKKQTNGKGDSA